MRIITKASLLRQGLSEHEFYGDLVFKLKKIVGSYNFSAQLIKIISHYKKIGYNINVLQQTACLVVNPITVDNFAFLFNCTPFACFFPSCVYYAFVGLCLYVPCGHLLTSWVSFEVSNCEFVTFPLVSWARCGT